MQLIPAFASIDFAVLPIGDNFTMDPEDAATAATMVQCKKVIGVHYDTFGYIKINKQQAIDNFKQKGIELLLPGIGDAVEM